jgi:RecA-family ATPase
MEIQFVQTPSLPPERAEKLRHILDDVRVAPPSEKLTAFGKAARRTAREIVGPTYPRQEAVDRLWTTAEVHGLVEQFDANIIQSELAAAFEAGDDDYDDDEQFVGQSPPSSRQDASIEREPASIIPATFITPAAWPDEAPPPVDMLVANRIPRGDVTSLHGDGGTGKTDIAIRLAANVARRASAWLGHAVETGPVVFISAEEPERDLRRRIWIHAERDGYRLETLTDLHLWLPGDDNDTVLATADRSGVMRPTPLFTSIKATIEAIEPVLVIVDSVAATFAGSQVDRTMWRAHSSISGGPWRAGQAARPCCCSTTLAFLGSRRAPAAAAIWIGGTPSDPRSTFDLPMTGPRPTAA